MTKAETSQSQAYSPFPKAWQWQKRHWLLVIGLTCLVLWWIAPSLKSSPTFQSAISYLPVIGGLAFATDNILKLTN